MYRPTRTPFTTTVISSHEACPAEFARVAHEMLTLMGCPDGDVQLQPTLDDDMLPCQIEHQIYPRHSVVIRYGLGTPKHLEEAWPMIAREVALASDDWKARSLAACAAAGMIAMSCAGRALRGTGVSRLMASGIETAAGVVAIFGSVQVSSRYMTYNADALVVDALARANLDGPLATYISSAKRNAVAHRCIGDFTPSVTGTERFKRIHERLDKKWGIDAVALVSGTSA